MKKTKHQKFKKGDIVEWESQSGGWEKKKKGTIIQVVEVGDNPLSYANERFLESLYKFKSNTLGYGMPRDHESYLVLVPGATPKQLPSIYWPRVVKLKKSKN